MHFLFENLLLKLVLIGFGVGLLTVSATPLQESICTKYHGFETGRLCRDGTCVDQETRCVEDPCPSHRPFVCDLGTQCVTTQDVCDGEFDCWDGLDEQGCDDQGPQSTPSTVCPASYKRCQGTCIRLLRRCADEDCAYYADFKCDGGATCLPWSYVCNRTAECADGADEDAPCQTEEEDDDDGGGGTSPIMYALIAAFALVILAWVIFMAARRYLKIQAFHHLEIQEAQPRQGGSLSNTQPVPDETIPPEEQSLNIPENPEHQPTPVLDPRGQRSSAHSQKELPPPSYEEAMASPPPYSPISQETF